MVVNKNLLCGTSTYFRTACNGQWSEAKEKTVQLKEADPETFAAYVNWLYTGQPDVFHDDADCTETGHPACQATDLLTDGYCLGDFLGDLVYCNFVTDTLMYLAPRYGFTPSLTFIKDRWPRLPKQSGLRRLQVDMQAKSAGEDEMRSIASTIPHEFLVEFGVALIKVRLFNYYGHPEYRPKDYYLDKTEEPKPQKPEVISATGGQGESIVKTV